MCSKSDHERLKTPSQWPNLPLVGTQEFPGMYPVQLRNCTRCYSTLAIGLRLALVPDYDNGK